MTSKVTELEPNIFVIFGGGGDLTWRKLIPAIFDISQDYDIFGVKFAIVCVDRLEMPDAKLRQHLHQGVIKYSRNGKAKKEEWNAFSKHITYLQGDFKKQQTYTNLKQVLEKFESEWKVKANYIFYMATPPSMFGEIPKHLHNAGLNHEQNKSRLVVEKPIGYDLQSTVALNTSLLQCFNESQIFRIDHYLGKETVQNILAFRFANPLFEPIWDRRYIEYVTITVAEKLGVEHRGGYYDHAGALRDMVQNHLMQLLCLVAMEPMVSFESDEIRNKKVDVLNAVRKITPDMVHDVAVRGQYCSGRIDGKEVRGYREEPGVAHDSQTETFVALKLLIDNWRWQDVPFYLRTGKRLSQQASEISIHFRAVPHHSFPPEAGLNWQGARLVLSIQPDEGIVLHFQAKYPGPELHLRSVNMRFCYEEAFAIQSPEAYETLLWDLLKNDQSLFMRADQVEGAWKVLMPILDMWSGVPPNAFPNYAAGTWGPEAADRLLALSGHWWPLPTQVYTPPPIKKQKAKAKS